MVAFLLLLVAAGFFGVRGVTDFHRDKVLSSAINSALQASSLTPSPFLRVYVSPQDKVPSVFLTVEVGRPDSHDAALTWVHVLFRVAETGSGGHRHQNPDTFGWKIALLCTPRGTVIVKDPFLSEHAGDPFPADQSVPEGKCRSASASSEIIVTGKYSPRIPEPVPTRDISQDTSGLVSFGIPSTAGPIVSNTGDDYQASFPHVTSETACSGVGSQFETSDLLSDGGPDPAAAESADPDCSDIESLNIMKVLDIPSKARYDDTAQAPTATLPVIIPRSGLGWQDTQDNTVLTVEANSPYQDAKAHVDEVYGAVCLGLAGAAAIALLTEARERGDDFRNWRRKLRKLLSA